MNTVQLVGRTTREIELKYTQSGKAFARFTLAIDRGYRDSAGQKITDYVPCQVWGNTAEVVGRYVAKGDRIGVTGSIQSGSYDKDGSRVFTLDVVADRVEFLENKKPSGNDKNTGFVPVEGKPGDADLPF